MLNNRFAREALKQAATQVNQGVRDGARHSSNVRLHRSVIVWTSSRGAWPGSSASSPSSCGIATEPVVEPQRPNSVLWD